MKALDLIIWFIFFVSGYITAHMEVSVECERLGGFYVGSQTYRCEVKR
jgi:hypothetical protein